MGSTVQTTTRISLSSQHSLELGTLIILIFASGIEVEPQFEQTQAVFLWNPGCMPLHYSHVVRITNQSGDGYS